METSGLIEWGGFLLIVAFVFLETGLLLGLIVPGGESLLFTAGLLVSTNTLQVNIITLLFCIMLAAIAGDISGFYIGRKFKDRLYRKKDTWYFKKKYLEMAEKYIEKHKKMALIFGKFLPIIRPFSPVISGTTRIPLAGFIPITLIAVLLYVSAFTLTGYFLGSQFPQIKNYLGYILPISILVALIPVINQIRKRR
ncbi:DedA family protein [Paradesertivirga mongoliensis]|uniref:DedA family protein n=1 Tax=Paradesertivirga mongoliensis TaxID=2100740 RepID=A0ABW4ZRV4_9SPHI|nr:DedA family protein [Pedobacter mongoliensis]